MLITLHNMDEIDDMIKSHELMLLKFDNIESKYNEFIDGLDFKVFKSGIKKNKTDLLLVTLPKFSSI